MLKHRSSDSHHFFKSYTFCSFKKNSGIQVYGILGERICPTSCKTFPFPKQQLNLKVIKSLQYFNLPARVYYLLSRTSVSSPIRLRNLLWSHSFCDGRNLLKKYRHNLSKLGSGVTWVWSTLALTLHTTLICFQRRERGSNTQKWWLTGHSWTVMLKYDKRFENFATRWLTRM